MKATKRFFWPILVIGVAMIALPFAISLPSRASHGQTMLDNFRPIMQPARVKKTLAYYDRTFVPLGPVAVVGGQAAIEAPQLIAGLGHQLHMSSAQVQGFLGTQFPAMGQLLGNLPQLKHVFAKVPPGLAFYKPLVNTMQANVVNYKELAGLPNFRLFTWFFVVPGILLVLLAGGPLLLRRGK